MTLIITNDSIKTITKKAEQRTEAIGKPEATPTTKQGNSIYYVTASSSLFVHAKDKKN